MRLSIAAAALLALALSAGANAEYARPVVVNGDTFDFNGVRYTVNGLEAPEIERANCQEERKLGVLAKAFAEELFRGVVVIKPRGERGGNPVADVYVGDRSYAMTMIQSGHGVPWESGQVNWCPAPPVTCPAPPVCPFEKQCPALKECPVNVESPQGVLGKGSLSVTFSAAFDWVLVLFTFYALWESRLTQLRAVRDTLVNFRTKILDFRRLPQMPNGKGISDPFEVPVRRFILYLGLFTFFQIVSRLYGIGETTIIQDIAKWLVSAFLGWVIFGEVLRIRRIARERWGDNGAKKFFGYLNRLLSKKFNNNKEALDAESGISVASVNYKLEAILWAAFGAPLVDLIFRVGGTTVNMLYFP